MALIRYGGGIVQMSGSIAGNTHARNRYGNYMRARTKPVNPSSTRQQIVRVAVSELAERWYTTVTAAQRTAWNTYAANVVMKNKLGESINLSGFNHYIRSNVWRLDLGQTIIDAGPAIQELPGKDATLTISASEATQLVTITFDDTKDWCSEDNAGIMILEGEPQNPTRNFFGGPYRGRSAKMGSVAVPITSPQTYAAIHHIYELQRLWCRFRIIRADGRLSEPWTANCFIAA